MPWPFDTVKKIFDHLGYPFPFTPPTPLENPQDPEQVMETLHQLMEKQKEIIRQYSSRKPSWFFEAAEDFKNQMIKKGAGPLLFFTAPLLPLFEGVMESGLPERVEDLWEKSGIPQGFRNFWADVERRHDQKLECLKSGQNKTLKSFTEEAIKHFITSKNGTFFSMENVQVHLDDGKIRITGVADFPGPNFNLELVIDLQAKDGKMKGRVERLNLDGAPINGTLLGIILDQVRNTGFHIPNNPDLNDLSWIEIPGLQSLEVKEGEISMEYSSC